MSSYIPQNLECVWLHKPYIHIYVNILFSQLKFAYYGQTMKIKNMKLNSLNFL